MLPWRTVLANVVGLRSKGSNVFPWLYLLLPVWLWGKLLNLSVWRELNRCIHEKHSQRLAQGEREEWEGRWGRDTKSLCQNLWAHLQTEQQCTEASIHFRVSTNTATCPGKELCLWLLWPSCRYGKRGGARETSYSLPESVLVFFFILVKIPWEI